jgi:hypothetical protein
MGRERREYLLGIRINAREIRRAVIDSHYEENHQGTISDELIMRLVQLLDGGVYPTQDVDGVFQYFVTDRMVLDGKFYKMIWLMEADSDYIGVINAYRRRVK